MSRRFHWLHICLAGLVAVAAVVGLATQATLRSYADEAADAVATDDAPADEDQSERQDPLVIPEGGPKELLTFLGEVAQLSVEGDTPEEQDEFRLRAIKAMTKASEMVLAAEPNNRQALEAYHYRLETLQAQVILGVEGAREKLAAAIDDARRDARDPIKAAGWSAHLSSAFGNWDELDDAAKGAVKEEILEAIRSGEPSMLHVSIISSAASTLADMDPTFAGDLLDEALPLLQGATDKKTLQALSDTNLEGVARRLRLPGNQMEITGTLLNGKAVNWDSYRGKVVLVDFWATWCGPCREEVPNVLAMFEAYHDKGFEVLGVSLDATEKDALEYVKENDIPWQSIFSKNKNERGWDSPLVRHYGINGIPTAILVDKDGKVVHMNARGGYLRQELQKLLGDPATPLESEDEESLD